MSKAVIDTHTLLGGAVTLKQPPRGGYRSGLDAVLLAAAVQTRAGDNVLELGCGVGAVGLCLLAREPELKVLGVDKQAVLLSLANENITLNNLEQQMSVVEANLLDLPAEIKAQQFDHVVMNPPFYKAGSLNAPQDPGRSAAHIEDGAELKDWLSIAAKRLKPKGKLVMIHHAGRLREVLAQLPEHLGKVTITMIHPTLKQGAIRFLMIAQQGGAAFTLSPPLFLHEGENRVYIPLIKRLLTEPISL